MAQDPSTQLEALIHQALKSGDAQELGAFLQSDISEETPMKCSQRFLMKLDKLMNRSLDQKDSRSASLGLVSLYKFGQNLKLPNGGEGISALIPQGLINKWFEKCRKLWVECGPQWHEALFTLSEDFLNTLMEVHEACKEGTYKVTESFLYPLGQLAVDPRIYILIQKEALRRFNSILDKIPVELMKNRKILTSQEAPDIMMKLAGQILEGGDYDFQSSLMEALCRMATPHQRKELANRWFSMEHVASAFAKIRDSEFETACRRFLNMVNGIQGDRRRVFSYPCLEVYLDKHELLMPRDEKLDEFWVDFNLGSHSISFYFSLDDEETQEGHWETICVHENEVQSYTVTEEGKRTVLQITMSEVVVVGAVEGSSLKIHFSSCLDILQAARNVYGHSKHKGTAVVKTTTEAILGENSTQVVPESQVSLGESEKNSSACFVPASAAPVQMVTPAKRRISESTTFICGSAGKIVHSGSSLSARGKDKSSLETVPPNDATLKTCGHGSVPGRAKAAGMEVQNTPRPEAAHVVLSGQSEEKSLEPSFLPDTQPRTGRSISSSWNKLSVSEMLMMPTQKMSSLPMPEPPSCLMGQQKRDSSLPQKLSVSVSGPVSQKLLHTELIQRLQQVIKERSKDPAPKTNMSNIGRDLKERSSRDQCVSSVCAPKAQQTQRSDRAQGNSKAQKSLEADAVPVKTQTTESLQEETPSKEVKVKTKKALSRNEKRDAEVAGKMVKHISSHYETNTQITEKNTAANISQNLIAPLINRPSFNMSWSASKREIFRTGSLMKSYSKTTTNSVRQRKDVFAFDIDTTLSIGGKKKSFANTSATSSSGANNSSAFLSTYKKGQPVEKKKRYVKKHLFSDTDTDGGVTEVSWLRESSRKPKLEITTYARQGPTKPTAGQPRNSYESPDLHPPCPKTAVNSNKPSKKKQTKAAAQPKKTVKPAAPSRPHGANRRPRRAAATSTKSYKETDTGDSQSEPEEPPAPKAKYSSANHLDNTEETRETPQMKKKNTTSKQPIKSFLKLESESVSGKLSTSKEYSFGQQQKKSETMCSEVPEIDKRNNTSCKLSSDSNKQSRLRKPSGLKQLRPENVIGETSTLNKKDVQEQMNTLKDSWAARQTSFCPSPPYMEKMRSAERSAPTLGLTCSPLLTPRGSPLSASPHPPCRDTPSPILLLPKPRSAAGSKGNCKPSSQGHSSSKAPSIQSYRSHPSLGGHTPAPSPLTGSTAAEHHLSSAPQSPLSLSARPLMTSTLRELDKPSPLQSSFPEDPVNDGHHYGSSNMSSVSQVSLSQSSTKSAVLTRRVQDSPTALLAESLKIEKTPRSDTGESLSGPNFSGPSRKRHIFNSSSSEEDENKEKKKRKTRMHRSPRMKPRKLFESATRPPHGRAPRWGEQSSSDEEDDKDSRPKYRPSKVVKGSISEEYKNTKKTVRDMTNGTVGELMSSSHVSSSHWEAEVVDGDVDMDDELELPEISVNPSNLCQQLGSELNKKFQNRFKMTEVYSKEWLKTVQHHISSINTQLTNCRTQRLGQIQKILSEEIHKLEQDDTALKNMEKDLMMCWKKQTVAFHSYLKQETRRNETLKRALQSDACHTLEYEERTFTSQMSMIQKDMKSVQDRLLKEMLDGEIQTVKRGLHALFFP